MAVSEMIQERLSEAMKAFSDEFKSPKFEVKIRSPKREGGDREFLLLMEGGKLAGIHVKQKSFKMYLNDDLVAVSTNKEMYKRLKGDQFINFDSVEECIEEVRSTLAKRGIIL